jgi:hypothetical protein
MRVSLPFDDRDQASSTYSFKWDEGKLEMRLVKAHRE